MRNIFVLVVAALISTAGIAQDAKQVKLFANENESIITYSMNHLLHSWTGDCKKVSAVILTDENRTIISQVAVSVKIADFDSQNANRDSHAIEITDAIKYPNVSFTSTDVKINGTKATVSGTISFHGVSQPLSFETDIKMVGSKLEISGNFVVLMSQFKIKAPSLMGISADDEIKVNFKTVF